METADRALAFWDERSSLGETAGTNDFVLSRIEQSFLVARVPRASRVLDIGCGNGSSLLKLVSQSECTGVGFDFSMAMVNAAKEKAAALGVGDEVQWYQRRVPPVPLEWGAFDCAYSQRCFINVTDRELQKQAVLSVAETLVPNGVYLMVECFNEGAEETNLLRRRLGLDPLEAPWHNLFFDLHEVKSWSTPNFFVEDVVHLSSTYHFLSRVINAKLAADSGAPLRYDDPINLLAAELPQNIGEFGPVKACIWRKR